MSDTNKATLRRLLDHSASGTLPLSMTWWRIISSISVRHLTYRATGPA